MNAGSYAVVVLISGRGSNLQALIDATTEGRIDARIRAVVSNEPDAVGLARAVDAGIETRVVDHRDYSSRVRFDRALGECVAALRPDLVVLAGFMRVLGAEFVSRFEGRLINIHPSLLPAFPGLDTHRRALEAGVSEHGVTVHFVTPELDAGPAIAQARVPVLPGDDAQTLAERVLEREHELLPRVVGWFAEGRLALGRDGQVMRDREALVRPVLIDT
jgi:phosphoribosylglycinamide formyltransferase-1